jgi:saccharopine dehydrogenase-like NADP-dependent oxidoreductase
MTASATIAIYGATGHTGRLVAAELLARGQRVLLSGRDTGALTTLAQELPSSESVDVLPATLDDRAALRTLVERAEVLIHCAGPFSLTGDPLAAAASEVGHHYIDHALEPHHVKHLFDTYSAAARRSGATMVPGLSFYGGFGDLRGAGLAGQVDRHFAHAEQLGWLDQIACTEVQLHLAVVVFGRSPAQRAWVGHETWCVAAGSAHAPC